MKKVIILAFLVLSFGAAFAQHPFYRYYNAKMKKHYYTTNFDEFGNGANGWALEGVACRVFRHPEGHPGVVTLFRFYKPQSADHYYTAGKFVPAGDLIGYNPEGPAGYIFPNRVPGTVPLFEYFNYQTGDHFYTTDKRELGHGFEGYHYNTVTGFVFPN